MEKTKNINLPTPMQIKEYLDQYVIGQDEAKITLSVAVYNHYKRIIHNSQNIGVEGETNIDKSNCLLLGPTGCGKTMLVKTIAQLLDVPYYIQDSTKLTASGYVGDDVENCLVGLLRACNYDIERAQIGIICLDEIEKTAKKEAGQSITRDVSGECVQQSLLKIVEGDVVGVPPNGGRKHPEAQQIYIDTKNILFIGSGAFVGLDEILKKKIGKTRIGFDNDNKTYNVTDNELYNYVTQEDIKSYGFIPEFVGRFPVITHVNKLTQDELIRILKEPKNSLVSQYKELLKMDDIELEFDNDAINEIAKLAYSNNTGARGLRNIFEKVMLKLMYTLPDSHKKTKKATKHIVTGEYVKQETENISKYLKVA